MSIGALSNATGVSVDTLRTWERRYGFPEPLRRNSGHRRYSLADVDRLRLIQQALALGHRPSEVVALDVGPLRELLAAHGAGPRQVEHPPVPRLTARPGDVRPWLEATVALHAELLVDAMARDWALLGAAAFVEQRAVPFLREVGERWRRGELGVVHEHFASQRLRDFVSERRQAHAPSGDGLRLVCATLPGERHEIALHLAGLILSLEGADLLFLGADTPLADTIAAVRHAGARAVVVASSFAADTAEAARGLGALRRALDPAVEVVVGGGDPRVEVDGVVRVGALSDLRVWYQGLAARDDDREA